MSWPPILEQVANAALAVGEELTGIQGLDVSRLLMKLDAHDRAQLVMIAYETRLVTPA